MNLTEAILEMQYQIQNSFDYLTILNNQTEENKSGQLHFSFENVELELPIIIEQVDKYISDKEISKTKEDYKFLKLPYNLKNQIENQTKKYKILRGTELSVKFISQDDLLKENFDLKLVSKIKINFKPVIR